MGNGWTKGKNGAECEIWRVLEVGGQFKRLKSIVYNSHEI